MTEGAPKVPYPPPSTPVRVELDPSDKSRKIVPDGLSGEDIERFAYWVGMEAQFHAMPVPTIQMTRRQARLVTERSCWWLDEEVRPVGANYSTGMLYGCPVDIVEEGE